MGFRLREWLTRDLVHVEDEPRQVAEDEHSDNEHQHGGHVVVLPLPAPHPPPHRHVDLGVEEGDGGEGQDAKDSKPGPVDVPGDVDVVEAKLRHVQVEHRVVALVVRRHLALKELADVEDDRKDECREEVAEEVVPVLGCVLLAPET